jgi:V/A-type H+-transporting ATPase subunit D
MPLIQAPPTKSALLTLSRQLAFAREGYELLEQKRQVLLIELMGLLKRARHAEERAGAALREAFAALRDATLDAGSDALDRAALGVATQHTIELTVRRTMGIRLPAAAIPPAAAAPAFGFGGTTANCDAARLRFAALVPLLAELAQLQTALFRIAHELRRTQRRCNALSKLFIPECESVIASIAATLDERERESFVILRMVRNRLEATRLQSEAEPCAT